MDNNLKLFWTDKGMKDSVYNYLISELERIAIKKVFDKENTVAIGEAKEVIDKAFENLENLFSPKVEKKEQVNQSR